MPSQQIFRCKYVLALIALCAIGWLVVNDYTFHRSCQMHDAQFNTVNTVNTEDTVKIDNNKIEVKTTEVDTTTRSMNEETLLDKIRNLRN